MPKSGPATLPDTEITEQRQLVPLYRVVLLDDDEHTYEYVVEMLVKLFCFSTAEAFQKAVEVDTTGRTIVITCELPAAEFARDQIHNYGADPRIPTCRGSMRAIIEPAAS